MGYFEVFPNGKSNFKTKKTTTQGVVMACSLWGMLNSNGKTR